MCVLEATVEVADGVPVVASTLWVCALEATAVVVPPTIWATPPEEVVFWPKSTVPAGVNAWVCPLGSTFVVDAVTLLTTGAVLEVIPVIQAAVDATDTELTTEAVLLTLTPLRQEAVDEADTFVRRLAVVAVTPLTTEAVPFAPTPLTTVVLPTLIAVTIVPDVRSNTPSE